MIVRLRPAAEALRSSLFFVPGLFVIFGVALAAGMLALDSRVDLEAVPSVLRFTVESARELLGTVAAAIITVAGIVFALTGLSIQLASSQFQPTHADLVGFAFDDIRQNAMSHPSLAAAMVETLAQVFADLAEDGITDRDRTEPLLRQVRLLVAGLEQAGPLPEDAAPVRDAAANLCRTSQERITDTPTPTI